MILPGLTSVCWGGGVQASCSEVDSGHSLSIKGFPGGISGREAICQCRRLKEMGVQFLERFPGRGKGNPLQYSCLVNPVDRGACWAIYSPWITKSQTQLK